MGRYINGFYVPDPGENDPFNPTYTPLPPGGELPDRWKDWWKAITAPPGTGVAPIGQIAGAQNVSAMKPAATPAAPAPVSDGEWSKVSKAYDLPVEERVGMLRGITQSAGPISGQGPNAVWRTPSGVVTSEGNLLKLQDQARIGDTAAMQELARLTTPAKPTAVGNITPAYVYQAQAANYQASADLARAQMADIPLAREQATQNFIAAEAARKFGQQAQIIGLQTNNNDLAIKGKDMAFNQGNVADQASNRIAELNIQQSNLQQQYNYNTSAANAAAINAANQFNAQMGFNVEQANVAAQQRRQEQLQSLARDISEAAKAPGDYGKLAALTLANTGWGAPATAIGKGADLRTTQSLAPLESQLRTRQDVMAQPDRPFTFTPYTAEMVQAPIVSPVDQSKFVIPQQTVTPQMIEQTKIAGDKAIAQLAGGGGASNNASSTQSFVDRLNSGESSQSVNAALNAAIAAQQGGGTGYTGMEEGGVIPRYEDGGVNMQDPMQAYQSGGANALYNALRSAGSSEQQAADFVNTVMRSDVALQQNTAAAQQAQAMQQAQAPMPQRPAYMPMTDASNDTEAQLLRLGMSTPYMGGGYGTGGTYGQEDAMPAAAGWSPQMPQQFTGYGNEVDAAPAAAGWVPQIADEFTQRKAQFDSDFSALKSGQISGNEFEKRNKDLDDNQFLQFTRLYGIPAAGSAALAAGAALPTFMKWLAKGNQYRYRPAFDYNILNSAVPQSAPFERGIDPNIMRSMGLGETIEDAERLGLYATGGVANGAYISGERGPELNIPLGDKTIVLNQKQMKAAGIDIKKLMSDSVKPKGFATGGVFDQGFGNVTDPDRTLSMQFLNDALDRARAGTPWQTGALPSPVYASTPGFSPLVMQTLGSLTSMAQGVPTEYFQELARKYAPSGLSESYGRMANIQRTA